MKNLIAALLLLFLSLGAYAQSFNPCTGISSTTLPPSLLDFDITKPIAVCQSHKPGSWEVNAEGLVEWDYCKNPATGKYGVRFVVTTRADVTNIAFVTDVLKAGWPKIDESQRLILAQRYASMVKPIWHADNAKVWCPALPKIAALRPPDEPLPPPTSQVYVAALAGNRFWLALNGKLTSPVSPPRFAVPGATCDCSAVRIVVGTVTYCPLPGQVTGEVTACRIKP